MMELFTNQEITAILSLLNRLPMTQAEMLYANSFFQRLMAFVQPPSQEETKRPEDSA